MEEIKTNGAVGLSWRVSRNVGALTDGERHVGHVIKASGQWHAYDAMHRSEGGAGFRLLGSFAALESAQQAVERIYGSPAVTDAPVA